MARKKRRGQAQRQPAPATDQPALSAEERAARRAEQKRIFDAEKAAKERAAQRSFAPLIWAGAVLVTLGILIPVGILLFAGGGDDEPEATPIVTQDPRLGGQSPTQTLEIATDDDGQNIRPRFVPTALTARAGEVFEVQVTNEGSVAHNMVIDGGDEEFDTPDDFSMSPFSIQPGETGTVRAIFDEEGTYQFECLLHPAVQVGTLTVIPGSGGSSSSATPATSRTAAPTPTASP